MEIRIGEPIQGLRRNKFKLLFTVWYQDGTSITRTYLIDKLDMEKYKDFIELIFWYRSSKPSPSKISERLSQIEDKHNFNFGALHCIVTNTGKILFPFIDQITFFDNSGIERTVKMVPENNNKSEYKTSRSLSSQ